MNFKVLKHKTLEDTFGVFHDFYDDGSHKYEIWHCARPELLKETTSIEILKEYWKDHSTVVKQLDDYEILDAELIIKK